MMSKRRRIVVRLDEGELAALQNAVASAIDSHDGCRGRSSEVATWKDLEWKLAHVKVGAVVEVVALDD